MALPADLESFAHGLEDGFGFRAHVRGIDRAGGGERLGQR